MSRPLSSSFVTMASLKPGGVERVNRWTRNADQRREGCYFEALAFSRYSIDLELDEQNMKPEKATKAPENAGKDPSTMKMKKWYQDQTRERDESQFQSPSHRASAARAPAATNRASYQAREPFEDDEERLAMRQGEMPPPVPERVANPRIERTE